MLTLQTLPTPAARCWSEATAPSWPQMGENDFYLAAATAAVSENCWHCVNSPLSRWRTCWRPETKRIHELKPGGKVWIRKEHLNTQRNSTPPPPHIQNHPVSNLSTPRPPLPLPHQNIYLHTSIKSPALWLKRWNTLYWDFQQPAYYYYCAEDSNQTGELRTQQHHLCFQRLWAD